MEHMANKIVDDVNPAKLWTLMLSEKQSATSNNNKHIQLYDIINEYKKAIKIYLEDQSINQSEPMLLDDKLIEKAKILKLLSEEIFRSQRNHLHTQDPKIIFQQTLSEIKFPNKHKADLLRSFLDGAVEKSTQRETAKI